MTADQPEPPTGGGEPAPRVPGAAPVPSGRAAGPQGVPYRAPRYRVFLLTGAVLGAVVGVVLAVSGDGDTVTTGAGVLGYLVAFGVFLGLLAGGTAAVAAESLMNRRVSPGRRGRARRPRGGTPRG